MSSAWPVASALLAGRYRLVTLLETGGMAEIWQAEDELLDRPVAVKLPIGPQVVWREARMAARLSHPGIAAVHDYRETVRPDGAVMPFVVMELLTGESVAARVDRERVGWAETARVGAAVADALAAAHANGVVHRDIKPGNVMLTPNGVKILDFGISVAAGEPDDDDTGATFGTPAYVAPERLDGMPAEPATDVYGVGVLLFEMVTGDPPYPVETWEELAAARVAGPSTLPESLPADFRAVVGRCLDADPARRPTAARLRADLLAVALRPAASAVASAVAAGVVAATELPTSSSVLGDTTASDSERPAAVRPATEARAGTSSGSLGALVRAANSTSAGFGSTGGAEGNVHSSTGPAGGAGNGHGSAGKDFSAAGRYGSADGHESGAASSARRYDPTLNGSGSNGSAGGPGSEAGADGSEGGYDSGSRDGADVRAGSGPHRSRRLSATRSFATGRAAATTVDMRPAPRRRVALGIGAAVVLAAVVGAFAVLAWTNRNTDTDVAIPPPAAAPQLPSATVTEASPKVGASTPSSPSPKASLTYADAVLRMRAAVEGGAASGQIRKDVANDLLNLLGPLSSAQGSDVDGQVAALRRKIQTRVGEGGVTPARATVLQSRLTDLDRAAGT